MTAVAHDRRRHALTKLRLQGTGTEQRGVVVRVHVDESGQHLPAGRIHDNGGRCIDPRAHLLDPLARDQHVAHERLTARAVEDPSAADQGEVTLPIHAASVLPFR
jgi:hypothetical protein